jgi:NAD-dependent SIR2 family protein deacetylase
LKAKAAKIMLFLGAGASKPFGYPTTRDFIEISNKELAGKHPLYNEILSFFRSQRKLELIDIEIILWELDKLEKGINFIEEPETFKKWFFVDSGRALYNTGSTHDPLVQVLGNTKSKIKQLRGDINKLVYDTYWKEPDTNFKTFYERLFDGIDHYRSVINSNDKNIDIFTTNYDLMIEKYFEKKGPIFSDGFAPVDRRSYSWDLSHYDNKGIRLYKLHGSIDWKRFKADGQIHRVPEHDYTKPEDHVILYPGFKGEPEIEPFKTLHAAFSDSLLTADQCIFIGFSFRDEYINRLVSEAVKENSRLKIYIWNPEKPDFEKLNINMPGDRTHYIEENFGDNLDALNKLTGMILAHSTVP